MFRMLLTGLLTLVVSMGAQAVTGSGDSETGVLETVSPTLDSVSAETEQSLSMTFSEAMLVPGVTTPDNFAVSGLGIGTLNPNPDGVSGSGPYSLTWSAGEMRDGATVTVTVTDLQDTAGNPVNPVQNNASCAGLGVAPVFTSLVANPAQASVGETVTITFTASEPLDGEPVVTVNGHEASWLNGGKGVNYMYQYEVRPDDSPGMAGVSVTGLDPAGNLGSLSSNTALEIVEGQAELPLHAWPAIAALMLAGIAVFAHKKRGLTQAKRSGDLSVPAFWFLLVTGLLASSAALAANPSVSNVTFAQTPTATGTQVDIYYDLDAPNDPCDITVSLSKDGGADGFIHPVTSVTGDLANVTTGTGKHIVWDIRTDYPEEDIPNAQIRVTADDGVVQYTLTYTAGDNGTIDGTSPQTVNHGESGTQVEAVPDTGYHFVNWSDGSTDNPRTDTSITANITVTANFAINTYTLTYTAGANGSITGTSSQTVNHGNNGTQVTAVPDTGYHFVNWSDGSTQNPRTDTNATGNITVTANFAINTYTLTYTAGANGSITGTSSQTVNHGNNGTQVTAVPDTDYHFVNWSDGSTQNPRTDTNATGNITVTANFASDERTILLPGNVPLELVWVPSGSYQMGRYPGEVDSSSSEDPRHGVTLAYGFWMGKYEITQQQWIAVRGSWPGSSPLAGYGLGGNYPAYYISWNDAKDFITTLNAYIISSGQDPLTVRLPSEAEWEYACRAGTATRFYFGDSTGCDGLCSDCAAGVMPGNRSAYMWYCGNNSPTGSKPVGGKTANAFGLYDMSGNVWEWCEDDYHGSYTGAPADGSAWIGSPRGSSRMLRGGYWQDNARYCRSAYRIGIAPANRIFYIGFRLAADH